LLSDAAKADFSALDSLYKRRQYGPHPFAHPAASRLIQRVAMQPATCCQRCYQNSALTAQRL
jgi:hypothetical protein